MAGQTCKCNNCGSVGVSLLKGSTWITVILIFFYIIPGIIYMIWRRSGLGACGVCKSVNLKPYTGEAKSLTTQESNDQVRCSECRELIRFDARKCKHCGSTVV